MSPTLIFLPVLAQILLTVALYVTLQRVKQRAARAGEVDESRRALHEDAWPAYVQQVNNSIRSQFEVPVLFYMLCFMLFALGAAGVAAQVLAWVFVASRVVHAWIHTHSNVIPVRRRAFIVGVAVVVVMAGLAGWHVAQGAA